VTGLPTNTRLFVRLWSLIGGQWLFNDYQYGPGAVTGVGLQVVNVTPTAPAATATRTPTRTATPTRTRTPNPTSAAG
jgi:hypothetical protein